MAFMWTMADPGAQAIEQEAIRNVGSSIAVMVGRGRCSCNPMSTRALLSTLDSDKTPLSYETPLSNFALHSKLRALRDGRHHRHPAGEPRGGAMQLHPGLAAVDPTLAFSNFQPLKLKHEKLLSNLAFDCKLRHYTVAVAIVFSCLVLIIMNIVVGWCRFNPAEACVECAWFQCLKLRYEKPLSNFAFNRSLRRYIVGFMHFWGLTIDSVTVIMLVIALGRGPPLY